jgi:hypothetical protein
MTIHNIISGKKKQISCDAITPLWDALKTAERLSNLCCLEPDEGRRGPSDVCSTSMPSAKSSLVA